MKSLKGLNRYLSVGVDANWIKKYLQDQTFEPGNRKTDVMFGMMNDAGMTLKKSSPISEDLYKAGILMILSPGRLCFAIWHTLLHLDGLFTISRLMTPT